MYAAAQTYAHKQKAGMNPYLTQKIMTASPEQLIAYVYDAGISACAQQDRNRALKVIQVLINSLNFEYREISTTFYNIYRYLNNSISRGNFAEAKTYFEDLKAIWSENMNVV
ncbi:MAG: flagellar protein FliS [Calditrichaeota bacterium]|nr:MAG: flagellar protein FliS [Calditrichota bacterium]